MWSLSLQQSPALGSFVISQGAFLHSLLPSPLLPSEHQFSTLNYYSLLGISTSTSNFIDFLTSQTSLTFSSFSTRNFNSPVIWNNLNSSLWLFPIQSAITRLLCQSSLFHSSGNQTYRNSCRGPCHILTLSRAPSRRLPATFLIYNLTDTHSRHEACSQASATQSDILRQGFTLRLWLALN